MAANTVGTNPIRIDTFGADVTIKSSGRLNVDAIVLTAYTSAKTVTFIDASGANCLVAEVPTGETVTISGPLQFSNGLVFDDSASDLAAGDFIFIFLP